MGKNFRNKTLPSAGSSFSQASPLQIPFSTRTSNQKTPKHFLLPKHYQDIVKYFVTKENTSDLALILLKRLFSPSDWKMYYFDKKDDWNDLNLTECRKDLRKMIQMGTLQALLRGKYFVEDLTVVPVEEIEEETQIPIHERVFVRKPYVPRKKEEVTVEEEPETKKKKKRRNKKPNPEAEFELTEEELAHDGTFEGFEIMAEDERPPLDEIIELNERNLKKDLKKQEKNKTNKKQTSSSSSSSAATKKPPKEESDDEEIFFFDDGIPEKEIPVTTIHLDFNAIKKISSSTELIDCTEMDSIVQQVSKKSLSTTNSTTVNQSTKTIFKVIQGDILEAALSLKKQKVNPLMLISASQTVPGALYDKGGNTQEEDMCRRSSLALCSVDPYRMSGRSWYYPLPEFGGIYVPNCLIIRKSKYEGYAFLDKPSNMSMFLMAPIINPATEKKKLESSISESSSNSNNDTPPPSSSNTSSSSSSDSYEYFLPAKLATTMKKKIASYLQVALNKGHDALVLSDFGCVNSHSNPSFHIATLFKEVLMSDLFRDKFKHVIFAITLDTEPDSRLTSIIEDVHHEVPTIESSYEIQKKNNLTIFSKVFNNNSESAPTIEEYFKKV